MLLTIIINGSSHLSKELYEISLLKVFWSITFLSIVGKSVAQYVESLEFDALSGAKKRRLDAAAQGGRLHVAHKAAADKGIDLLLIGTGPDCAHLTGSWVSSHDRLTVHSEETPRRSGVSDIGALESGASRIRASGYR